MYKRKNKRSFIRSIKNCFDGLNFVIINEHNFKREIIIAIVVLLTCYLLRVSTLEFIIILIIIALVLVSEIFNTAIEKAVDLYTKEYNEIAKITKDVSAFAVLAMCFFAFVVGIIIFIPKIINLLGR